MITSEIRPAAYQLVPLTKLILNQLNGLLIADGVGLGKTISASLLAVYFSQLQELPTAVVCSPILVTKWLTELRSKFGISAFAVRSEEHLTTANQEMRLRPLNFYVFSSSLLSRSIPIDFPHFGLTVFDEIHNYRNNRTRSYASALELAKKSKLRVGLSATPINNSLDDLASEIALLLAEENWDAVSAIVRDLWSWNKQRITKPLVTRFVKEKLPMHFSRREVLMVNVRYSTSYMHLVERVLRKIGMDTNIYELITYLRLAASCPHAFLKKFRLRDIDVDDKKLEITQAILSSREITRWLLFVEFVSTARYLESAIQCRPVFLISGKTPLFERDEIIQSFRRSKEGVLIMTPVGGEGLDLQFCQGIINYDMHWNPMKIEQRIGRIDRIGQTKNWIKVINLRVVDSIDDHVLRVIFKKLSLTQKSIFATKEIVSGRGEGASPLKQRAIETELGDSKAIISALNYSATLDQEDYRLLRSIDERYCTPAPLKKAAKARPLSPLWLKPRSDSRTWSEVIQQEAARFQEGLRDYK